MRAGFGWEEFCDAKRKKRGDSWFDRVGSSMSVARTVEAILWENSDFFMSPNSAMKNS